MSELLEIPVLRASIKAGEALTGQRFVKVDGTYADATENAIGVTYTDAADDDYVAVTTLGIVPVETTAAAITAGAKVKAAADGKAIAHSGSDPVLARAMTAVPAAGGVILVHLIPN